MAQGLYLDGEGRPCLAPCPLAPVGPDACRVRIELATIKHGTLFTGLGSDSPFRGRRFDLAQRLFVADPSATQPRGQFLGNMVVGTVAEIGSAVTLHAIGDRVYGHAPIQEEVVAPQQAWTRLGDLDPTDALCLDPALFAYGGIRDGRIGLGDAVALFGLGAIGLHAVQLLRLAGCSRIIAVDPIARRREVALALGADLAIDPVAADPAQRIRQELGSGVDVAIEASGSYRALCAAIPCVRQCGRVVSVGFYPGRDSQLELGAEFFHNRLELIASLPAWSNPLRDAPLWTEARLRSTLVEWFRHRRLSGRAILDPVVAFSDSPAAFSRLRDDPGWAIKLGVRFPS